MDAFCTVNFWAFSSDRFSMKKSILLSLVLVSSTSFAQTAGDVVKQLQSLQKNLNLDPVCNTCEEVKPAPSNAPSGGVGPASALDLMSGPLTFLGRDLFPGSDQNRTCVYKSATAYILYGNCMSSKKEAAATDITVIDFNGGMTHYYVENKETEPAISLRDRSQYDSTWTVDYIPSDAPGTLNVNGLKSYMESYSMINNKKGACFIGGSFKAQDMSVRSQCFGAVKGTATASEWSENADSFWRQPGQKWHDTLKSLRKTVVGTKF